MLFGNLRIYFASLGSTLGTQHEQRPVEELAQAVVARDIALIQRLIGDLATACVAFGDADVDQIPVLRRALADKFDQFGLAAVFEQRQGAVTFPVKPSWNTSRSVLPAR